MINNDFGVEIIGLGQYLPKRVVNNDELIPKISKTINKVDNAVLGEIGVYSRHWSNKEETVPYMAAKAAEQAINNAQILPETIDLFILSNWTSREYLPELAPQAAYLANTKNALAFDLCGACTGFIMGVMTASMYLKARQVKRAVVVGCDQFAKRVRPGSKGQLVCGDAAGAAILELKTSNSISSVIDVLLKSDGSLSDVVKAPGPNGWVKSRMDLVDEAIHKNMDAAEEILSRNGLNIKDVDWVVPHPGTDLVHKGIQKRLEIEEKKFVVNFSYRGNTSSASIPIVLSEFYEKGIFKKGDLFLCPAIGSGLFYGSLLFRL